MTSTSVDVIDGVSTSTAIKAPVRCATTANITLSGLQTIDGIVLAEDDENLRVLVKDQTDATENGIYDASSSAWTRAADFDGNRDVRMGTQVSINEGTIHENANWRVTTTDPIVIGTSEIEFENVPLLEVASAITGATAKTTPVDADTMPLSDSADSNAIKKVTWANIKATLKAYFDTLYQPLRSVLTNTTASFTTALETKLNGIEDLADVTDVGNISSSIAGATAKTTPVAADIIGILDSAASNAVKKSTIQQIITALNIFSSINLQVFTTTGANTYTPTSGMKYCLVISTGGGGGGGGADTDGSSGLIGLGSGGGAGGTCIEYFTAATIGASQTVTIGTAGAAGSGTNGTDGGAGGDTTFGALHTAAGGAAGQGSGVPGSSSPDRGGGAGGAGTGGTVNITGGYGGAAVGGSIDGTTDLAFGISGHGGSSFWGGGGGAVAASEASLTTDNTMAGIAGQAYGSGGSGAVDLTSTTGGAGGAGAAGICVVIEFI